MKIFSLKGKNIVITGGYGHLGKHITEAILEAEGNAIVCGRNEDKFKQVFKKSKRLDFFYMDISDEESINQAVEKIIQKYGYINGLVNNAAFTVSKKFEELTTEDLKKGIEGTLVSTFSVIKAVYPYMKNTTGASIVNISSMYGIVSPDFRIYENAKQFLNPINYGAGKAGVIQLTKYLAVYLAKYGIRVNCISPGAFPSEYVKKNKDFIKKLEEKIPLGRIGNPKELKGATIFLLSEASSYITGHNLIVDGGWTVW